MGHEYRTADQREPFDSVYDDRFAGEDTLSQLTIAHFGGGGGGERAAMPFDNVYDSRFAGEDTRSQLTAANFGGGGELAVMPEGLSVFSHAHAGKTSRSSIVFGTYQEPTPPPRRRNDGHLSDRRGGGGGRAALPPMSGRSTAAPAPMRFDGVYSSAHAGKDTRSQISFGGGAGAAAPMPYDGVYSSAHAGKDTRSSVPLGGSGVTRAPLQHGGGGGGHAYPLPPDAGPAPRMSPLRARASALQPDQYNRARAELGYSPSPSVESSGRERALEGRVEKLEEQVAYLLGLLRGS